MRKLLVTGIFCSALLIHGCGTENGSQMDSLLGQAASEPGDDVISANSGPGVRTLVPVSYSWDVVVKAFGICGETCAISAEIRQEGDEVYLDIIYTQAPPRIPVQTAYED
jgi:hypothetical protein